MDKITKACTQVLKKVFGYDSFRPLQMEIIKSVLQGNDTVAIMPTGGGKSICYQIPALLFSGITVVISPLISLMQDQVTSLLENGINATFLNSTLDWDSYLEKVREIKQGNTKLVYISPEALSTERVQSILHDVKGGISCITIDEAHCISAWGHDFRPNYLEIASVRHQFPNAVCLALTATATKQVQEDIIFQLKMRNPQIFKASFNRKNIFLEVRQRKNAEKQVEEFLLNHKDESGIIYCLSRKQAESLTDELNRKGFSVLCYHAGLNDKVRAQNQDLFIKDKVKIIVATVAFGMGINKPNVRFVINFDLPKSIEEYYQEIGRAGRDGLQSYALLLYGTQDIHKIRFFFQDAADPQKSEQLLQKMLNYATGHYCRRKTLLNYFGEKYNSEQEFCCDICSNAPVDKTDITIEAQKFLSCIYRVRERYGAAYIIDILLGAKTKRILDNNHDTLSTYGIGKELTKDDWFEVANALIEEGYITKYGDYNVLQVLPKGKNALVTRQEIRLPVIISKNRVLNEKPRKNLSPVALKKASFIKNLSDSDMTLYLKIKEWRKKEADELNLAPYQIFGDKTLEELVEKKPRTESELLSVFGIGNMKAEKLGSQILRLISEE